MYEMAGRHNLRRQFCVTEPGSGERAGEGEPCGSHRFRQRWIAILANAAISATVLAAAIASLPSHPIVPSSHHPKLQDTTSQKYPPLLHGPRISLAIIGLFTNGSLPSAHVRSQSPVSLAATRDPRLEPTARCIQHTGKGRCSNGIPLNRLFVAHADRGAPERSFQRNPSM